MPLNQTSRYPVNLASEEKIAGLQHYENFLAKGLW